MGYRVPCWCLILMLFFKNAKFAFIWDRVITNPALAALQHKIEGKSLLSKDEDLLLLPCISPQNKLLSNLYLDYFRSSGSCRSNDGTIVRTFSSGQNNLNIAKEGNDVLPNEDICKNSPNDCLSGGRDGRLFFGIGKQIMNKFNYKIQKIMSFFLGRGYGYGGGGGFPFPFFDQPSPQYGAFDQAWQSQDSPQRPPYPPPPATITGATPTPSHGAPPAPPPQPPRPSPFSLAALIPPIFGGYAPRPTYPQPPYAPPPGYSFPPWGSYAPSRTYNIPYVPPYNPYQQPLHDDPCSKPNGCPQNDKKDRVGVEAETSKLQENSRTIDKRETCISYGDVVFPMLGISALDNSTVTILQDFPSLVQPVFFRKCRSQYPSFGGGKCIQEYLPVNLFVVASSNSKHDGTLLPQEFVLVESGCKFQEKVSTFNYRSLISDLQTNDSSTS